jgi:membrane dipeptidase
MIVLDAHEDVILRVANRGDDLGQNSPYQADIPKWRAGGINAVWFAIWVDQRKFTGQNAVRRTRQLLETLDRQLARHSDHLALCDTANDVRRAAAAGKIAALIGIEGGVALDNNPALIEAYRRLHVRYLTLTWRTNLAWAGSSQASNPKVGLNALGRQMVAEMNRVGVIPDLSHVSDQTFYDVLAVTSKPVIVSHSNARALAPHPRNITDDMLRALAQNGGVIGINFWQELLRGRDAKGRLKPASSVDVETVLDHIDHVIKVAGIDHVGFGSDWEGIASPANGLENAAQMGKVLDGLRRRGYNEGEIRKIAGENFLRVLEANE